MNIAWDQLITRAMKDKIAAEKKLTDAVAETASRRAIADTAIAPLQDAVDIDDASDAEIALLKSWKKFRIALNRIPDQPGYPGSIEWPIAPA